jgi:hypothetical protein
MIAMFASHQQRNLRKRLWVMVLVLLTGLGNGAAVLAMPVSGGQTHSLSDAPCAPGEHNSSPGDRHSPGSSSCCSGDSGICAFHCMTPIPGTAVSFDVATSALQPPRAVVTTPAQRTLRPPLRPPRA